MLRLVQSAYVKTFLFSIFFISSLWRSKYEKRFDILICYYFSITDRRGLLF